MTFEKEGEGQAYCPISFDMNESSYLHYLEEKMEIKKCERFLD